MGLMVILNGKSLWYIRGNDVYLPQDTAKWGSNLICKNIMLLKLSYTYHEEYECVLPNQIIKGFNKLELFDNTKILVNSDYIAKVEWGDLIQLNYFVDDEMKILNLIVPEGGKINLINEYKCLNTYAIKLS